MLNSYKELVTLINEIKENIDKYSTDDGRKIKKNNEEINKLITVLMHSKEIILNKLLSFSKELIPTQKNESISLTKDNIKNLINIQNTLNGYNTNEILGINELIYKLNNSTNLEDIISYIQNIIEIFKKANINLTPDNFKYSLSVNEFMTSLLTTENNNLETYEKHIKEVFESLFWKNPDIIKEVILNFYLLLNTYKKELDIYKEKYIKEILNNHEEYEIIPNIKSELTKLDNIKNYDLYITINNFLEDKENINDYLKDSKNLNDSISKIIDINKYNNYNDSELTDFYNNIHCLLTSIKEFEFIKLYEPLLKDIIDIYNKKDELKDELKNKLSTIDKLLKEKTKLDSKLYSLLTKLKKISNPNQTGLFGKKISPSKIDKLKIEISKLEKDIDTKIDEIKEEYKNITDIEFNNLIITNLNDNSTIYDAMYLYLKNITKFKLSIIKHFPNNDIDETINNYTNFLYNPYNVIISTLKVKDSIEFNTLIEEKYKLYNINCKVEDNNKDLKNTLEFLLKEYYLNKCPISRNDIKLLCNINKIKDSDN